MSEYLVELYVSRGKPQDAESECSSACAAAEALTEGGTRVEYRRSILLASEETCFLLFDADNIEAVREMAEIAKLDSSHVSPVTRVDLRDSRGATDRPRCSPTKSQPIVGATRSRATRPAGGIEHA